MRGDPVRRLQRYGDQRDSGQGGGLPRDQPERLQGTLLRQHRLHMESNQNSLLNFK